MQEQPTSLPAESMVAAKGVDAAWLFSELVKLTSALVDGKVTIEEYDQRKAELQNLKVNWS